MRLRAIFKNFERTIFFANNQELECFKQQALDEGCLRFEKVRS